MKLPQFDYVSPATIEEAIGHLSQADGNACIISGGQSLMPMLAFRLVQPALLVDLRHIPGLDKIALKSDGVHLGAKVRWCDIEASGELSTAHPLLKAAVRNIAHHQIRTRGTVGGSIAHADPAAETAMRGSSVRCNDNGCRTVRRAENSGDYVFRRTSDDRIAIRRDHHPHTTCQLGQRPAAGHSRNLQCVEATSLWAESACFSNLTRPSRKMCTSRPSAWPIRPFVLQTPRRSSKDAPLSEALIKDCCNSAQADIDPKDDIHGSSAYRRSLINYLLEKALQHSMKNPNAVSRNAH